MYILRSKAVERLRHHGGHVVIKDKLLLLYALQQLPAEAVHRHALLVHYVVILQDVFAGFKMLALNGLLSSLNAAADQARFNGHALFHAQLLQKRGNPGARKDAHKIIFQREEETRRTGIALTSRAPPELVINASRLMAFRAQNMQTAHAHHLFVLNVGISLVLVENLVPLRRGALEFGTVVVK